MHYMPVLDKVVGYLVALTPLLLGVPAAVIAIMKTRKDARKRELNEKENGTPEDAAPVVAVGVPIALPQDKTISILESQHTEDLDEIKELKARLRKANKKLEDNNLSQY